MIELFNQYGGIWLKYFGFAVLQNTVFLIFVFLAILILKNASAKIKHGIAVIGLVKLLLPPFIPGPFSENLSTAKVQTESASFNQVISIFEPGSFIPNFTFPGFLLLIWIIASAAYLMFSIGSTFLLKRKLAKTAQIYQEREEHPEIRIYQSTQAIAPLSVGIFPNKVFLPPIWKTLPTDCQKIMLRHELAHIKRRDGLFQLLQILVQALYFFHPLVWLLNEHINEYREMACDDAAMEGANVSPLAYSRYLVHAAEFMALPKWRHASATALIRQKTKLLKRVNYQMKEKSMRQISKNKIGFIVLILCMLFPPLSWTFSKIQKEQEKPTKQNSKTADTAKQEWLSFPQPVGGVEAVQKNLVYPKAAREAGLEGKVELKVTVDEKSKVESVEIYKTTFEKGNDLGCHQAAIDAAKSVKWKTLRVLDQVGSGWRTIPVVFKLKNIPIKKTLQSNVSNEKVSKEVGKITGVVVDVTTGKPIPGANVLLFEWQNESFYRNARAVATDDNGQYWLSGVPVGSYDLKVAMIGFAKVEFKSVQVARNWTTQIDVKLKPQVVKLEGSNDSALPPPPPPLPDNDLTPPPPPPTLSDIKKNAMYEKAPSPVGGMKSVFKKVWENPNFVKIAGMAAKEDPISIIAQIDEKGRVVNVNVWKSSGSDEMDEMLLKSVKLCKWEPAKQRGKPVKVWVSIPVEPEF